MNERADRRIKWDDAEGRRLWNEGLPIAEIARRLCLAPGTIRKRAKRKEWATRHTKNLPPKFAMARRCYECLAPYDATNPHECKGRAVSPRLGLGWAA